MQPFEFAEPKTLREAIALLHADDTNIRPMSGGTALMLMMKAGVMRPTRLVSLGKLGLDKIEIGPGGGLRIGSMVSLRQLEKSDLVRRGWPAIARTLLTLSNVRVRNVARLGGHLAHGDPHTDLPPLLSALGAVATIAGPAGERQAPVEALYAGYLETTLAPNELIVRIDVPAMGKKQAAYLKCTTRAVDDWPAVGVAVVLDGEMQTIFVSAATDKPTRLASIDQVDGLSIESDLHGSAAYKKQLIRVYAKRAIHEARNPAR
jgi:aerobic carbon-monoxide dehydrogenase medium subunit